MFSTTFIFVSLLSASSFALAQTSATAPAGCFKLPTDADWPSPEVWKSELKGAEARAPSTKKWTSPDFTYEASKPSHVQNAVKFAAKHRVRLSIMNSGHDFMGRNDAPSGIRLTVTDIKGIRVLESYTPTAKGAEPVDSKSPPNQIKPVEGKQAAVTVGGGINIDELNKVLKKSGLYAVGAAHGEVSVAGGWAQGGGHGALSSYYGLGADQVLEYKVVTATGDLVVANAVTNPDLFWALRGGGPSTFGVVVEATIKVFPQPKIMSYSFWVNTTDYDDNKSIWPAAAYLCSQLPRLNRDGGFQGYFTFFPNAMSANFIIPNEFANASRITNIFAPVLDKIVSMPGIGAKSLIKIPPVSLSASSMGSLQGAGGEQAIPGAAMQMPANQPMAGTQPMAGMSHGRSRRSAFARRHGPGETAAMSRGLVDMDSRLLGEAELNHPKLAEALGNALPKLDNGQLRSHLVGGNKVMQLGNDTSVLPAWRKAYVHLIASTAAGTPDIQSLRDISPDMGAYINEAWTRNPNWKKDFWGTNYEKLAQIKEKWDPDMLFYVTPGINADKMVAKDGRLCRMPAGQQASLMPENRPPLGDNQNVGDHDKARSSFPILYQGKGVPAKMAGMPKMGVPKASAPPVAAATGSGL